MSLHPRPLGVRRLGATLVVLLMAGSLAAPAGARSSDDADATYRFDSRITTDFGGGSDRIGALVTQPDGNVVAGGTGGGDGRFALARYRSDGTLDPAFGASGLVTTAIGGGGEIRALALQPDGKIVAAGVAVPAGHPNGGVPAQFALARYLPDGHLDPSFGAGGTVMTTIVPGITAIGRSVVVDADGRIVVGGQAGLGGTGYNGVFALARYLPDGRPDPAFGGTGIVTTDVSPGDDDLRALLLTPDGTLIAAGSSSSQRSPAVVRYLPDGRVERIFDQSHGPVDANQLGDVEAAALQADGKVVIGGSVVGDQPGFLLVRYLADGSVDPSFGDGGEVRTPMGSQAAVAALTMQTNGKIVAAGTVDFAGQYQFALARYLPDGTLDRTFGVAGTAMTDFTPVVDEASAVTIAQGRIIAGGQSNFTGPGGTDFALAGLPGPLLPLPDPGAETPAGTATARNLTAAGQRGYWTLASDGHVSPFGDAPRLGDTTAGAVDLEPTPTGLGYWTLNQSGQVQAFGDARLIGRITTKGLLKNEKPSSLSATPTGEGYWIFTTIGRVFAFGDAAFLGDMSKTTMVGPVRDSVATPTGRGYYMVGSDGGIFAYGDAAFAGSMGGRPLNAAVESLVPDSDGAGYWLVGSDGGIFAFDAPFRGSMGATHLNKPVSGMVRYGDGYLMVGADGGIFNFSSSPFAGSLGDKPPAAPVVAVAALP
ncbi:MAG: hypothetical protein QOE80_2075 [Actinomycetota bacterium]|nr:hypothetical protein [Actinomycetota bacterium]